MNWNVEIRITHIHGDHPVPLLNGIQDRLGGLHGKLGLYYEVVEAGDSQNWFPLPQGLED